MHSHDITGGLADRSPVPAACCRQQSDSILLISEAQGTSFQRTHLSVSGDPADETRGKWRCPCRIVKIDSRGIRDLNLLERRVSKYHLIAAAFPFPLLRHDRTAHLAIFASNERRKRDGKLDARRPLVYSFYRSCSWSAILIIISGVHKMPITNTGGSKVSCTRNFFSPAVTTFYRII